MHKQLGTQFHLELFLMLDDCFSGEVNQYGNYEPHNNGYDLIDPQSMSVITEIENSKHSHTGKERRQYDCPNHGNPSNDQTCISLDEQTKDATEDNISTDDQ